jgi:hypothetical protein
MMRMYRVRDRSMLNSAFASVSFSSAVVVASLRHRVNAPAHAGRVHCTPHVVHDDAAAAAAAAFGDNDGGARPSIGAPRRVGVMVRPRRPQRTCNVQRCRYRLETSLRPQPLSCALRTRAERHRERHRSRQRRGVATVAAETGERARVWPAAKPGLGVPPITCEVNVSE